MKKSFLLLFIFTGSMQAQQPPQAAFTFVQAIPRLESLAASAVNPANIPELYRTFQVCGYPLRNLARDMQLQETDNETLLAALKKSNSELLNLRFLKNSGLTTDKKLQFVKETIRTAIITYYNPRLGKINPPYDIVENILTCSQGIPNKLLNDLLFVADSRRKTDMIVLLLSYMHHKNETVTSFYNRWNYFPLHKSIVDGSINEQIKNGLTIHYTTINLQATQKKLTPLHLAAGYNSPSVVQFLINQGANSNAQNSDGETPLHRASQYGNSRTAEVLLKHEALVNSEDRDGKTPLYSACEQGHTDCVKLLFTYGAHTKTKSPNQPLHLAARNSLAEIVHLLLENGADIEAKNMYETRPLHVAVQHGNIETVKLLIKKGANVNAKNLQGDTPLLIARRKKHTEIVELFIEHGAQE